MRFWTDTPANERVVVFLLVDEGDPMLTALGGLDPATIEASATIVPTDGSPGISVVLSVIAESDKPGWYSVLLPEVTIPASVILVAKAPGSYEWRDVIQIEPAPVVADVQAAIAEEFSKWVMELDVPVKFVRAGQVT